MAFPDIRSQVTDNATANETTHTVSLPATIQAGDTILVIIRVTVAGAIGWPDASWNELYDESPDASDDQQAAAWKKADGSEGGTTISVTSGNGKFTSVAIAVKDATDPTLTPPTLGTAATGSATEPDPGNCNPGSAKDYLWFTFFGMEGEQTGITAYPANFTLHQSGIVTTGTTGAVTTNCTMASAARQLNASSLDAGVWDVTGTLDDWTARTIAFHPAEPVEQPLPNGGRSIPNVFRSTVRSVVLLTTAVNLLQSTLRPDDEAFSQNNWPNPLRSGQIILDINSRPQQDGEAPLVPIDWKNPDLTKIADNKTWLNNNLQNTLAPVEEALPFNQYNHPNPLLKKRLITSIGNRVINPSVKSEIITFVPSPKKALATTWVNGNLQNTLIPTEEAPILPITFNNPILSTTLNKGWIQSQRLEESEEVPFIPVDYPNPLLKGQQNKGSVQARPFHYTDQYPVGAHEFELPNPKLLSHRTWTNNNLQNTLKPEEEQLPFGTIQFNPILRTSSIIIESSIQPPEVAVQVPFNQKDWSNPKTGYESQVVSNEHFLNITPITNTPTGRSVQFIPERKIKQNVGTTSSYIFNFFGDTPTIPPNYPNPIIKREFSQRGFIKYQQLERIVGNPLTPVVFPNPSHKQVPVRDYIWSTPANYISPQGFSCAITLGIGAPGDITCFTLVGLDANPQPDIQGKISNEYVLRGKAGITWLQSRPSYYVDEVINSKSTFDYPIVRKPVNQGFIQSRPFYYTQDTSVPFKQGDWPNPSDKLFSLITDISTQNSDTTIGTPNRQRDWPNPVLRPKRAIPWDDHFILDDNQPDRIRHTVLPPARRIPLVNTWVQAPLISSPVFVPPVSSQLTKLPLVKSRIALTFVNPSLSVVQLPIGQVEWSNPNVIRILPITWLQNKPFFFEESIPIGNSSTVLPTLIRKTALTWIHSRKLLEEPNPLLNIDNPNPIVRVRPTKVWIVNLLQSTLEPAPGDTPFNQTNYPNPFIKGRGIDWIHSKSVVTIEEIPIRQNDYPNPRIKGRNDVSWSQERKIYYEEPLPPFYQIYWPNPFLAKVKVQDWNHGTILTTLNPFPVAKSAAEPNPLRKIQDRTLLTFIKDRDINLQDVIIPQNVEFPTPKARFENQTWIYSSLNVIAVPPGILPFNQTDWPLFIKVRRNTDLLTLVNTLASFLPQIKGRVICLFSDATDYDLFSELEDYDLESMFIIYDIDSGGTECQ